MAKDMAALVAKVQTKSSSKAKEYAAASEWPKCQVAGCPLPTTIKEGGCTCTYHYKERGFSAECLTEAIKEHAPYMNKLNEMVFWNVRQWQERKAQIMGWPVLPATDLEMRLPTLYLTRLRKWIDVSIKERASEIYQGH